MKKSVVCLFLLALCALVGNLCAQTDALHVSGSEKEVIVLARESDTTSRRLKVGVVLCGGGAKGYSHIGALKVIEDAGIKIDYIGGTSMGAIIGSAYAAGWNVRQLDSLARSMSASSLELFNDKPNRRFKRFYEKENENKTWIKFNFDNYKFAMPSGISKGQRVMNLYADWVLPGQGYSDFDSLPVPFVCRATDIVNGRSVSLTKGYLAEAIRASGNYPSLLTPFQIDSVLYIDGGVLDNFPIQAVKDMGADIIIGVELSIGLVKKEKLNSILGIVGQMVAFQRVDNSNAQNALMDVAIKPRVDKFAVTDFSNYDTIRALGEAAARQQWDALREVARRQNNPDGMLTAMAGYDTPKDYLVTKIVAVGSQNYEQKYILNQLKVELPSRVTLNEIHTWVDKVYATGNFSNVYYRLRDEGNGKRVELIVVDNPSKKSVGLGLGYDNLMKARLLLNATFKNWGLENSVFDVDILLGANPSVNLSYFLDRGLKISPGINVNAGLLNAKTNMAFELDNSSVSSQKEIGYFKAGIAFNNVTVQLYMQSTLLQRHTLGAGIEYSYIKAHSTDILDGKNRSRYTDENNYLNPYVFLRGDTRDQAEFTTQGTYYNLEYKLLMFSRNGSFVIPSYLKARLVQTVPIGKRVALGYDAFAGFSFSAGEKGLPLPYRFMVGGVREPIPMNLVEFYGLPFFWNSNQINSSLILPDFNDLGVSDFVKIAGRVQVMPFHNNYVSFVYNYGWVGQGPNNRFRNAKQVSGMGLEYGINTPLGPAKVSGTFSPTMPSNQKFGAYFSVFIPY